MKLTQMRYLGLIVLVSLALFTSGCFGLFGDRTYDLTVKVEDSVTGDPIAGAAVTVDGGSPLGTGNTGRVLFTKLSGTVDIVVTADGYAPSYEEVTMNQDRTEIIELEPLQTIAEIVDSRDDFSTLLAALVAANLVDTLAGPGPFTVFAPTDEAFADLPEGKLGELLADEDALTAVLLYHVVSGKVMAADVVTLDGETVETLQGDTVLVTVDGGTVLINDSTVIETDIEASNGVIHVIDAVLLPPDNGNGE